MKVLFDTETTGLIKPEANDVNDQPYITEIFCAKIDDEYNLVEEYGTFIKPPIPLPADVIKITGITDEMLEGAPSFREVYEELAQFFIGVDEVIAHNLPFDRNMLANELVRIGKVIQFPWPPIHTCTVQKSMGIEQRRLNLNALHKYATGKDIVNAHRAKDDVYALVRSYHWLMENNDE
jgi:DNA polymerase III epsilon subunit family exonuclease